MSRLAKKASLRLGLLPSLILECRVTEPRTENQCREDYTRSCDRNAQELNDSIKAGRVNLDAARLNDCLNAVLAPGSSVSTALPWTWRSVRQRPFGNCC